jgi:hypothetical protein
MSLVISKVFTYDTDAGNYIQAVEAADGQALEPATRQVINNFVIGCKQDGIWNAIKASCILSGARTLNGALQPLAGTAPTNNNFVSGDYNRKTGLVGNGTSKYLNSNRAANADPQNTHHLAIHTTFVENRTEVRMGAQASLWDNTITALNTNVVYMIPRGPMSGASMEYSVSTSATLTGFCGASRTGATALTHRIGGVTRGPFAQTSETPGAVNTFVFARNANGTPTTYSTCRLAFYSIGESLDLALLDARVTALITAFGVAIP